MRIKRPSDEIESLVLLPLDIVAELREIEKKGENVSKKGLGHRTMDK